MNRAVPKAVWGVGRLTLQPVTYFVSRLHHHGSERIPRFGGAVLALNHFSWLDPAAFGASCPRTIFYLAKFEAHLLPLLGHLIRAFGTSPLRRGESDREAVRMTLHLVRDGELRGLFVEGTR